MENSLTVIVVIFIAVIIMFVFPLMTLADRTDDIAQLTVQAATTNFVDTVRSTGRLTYDDYEKFLQTITSTGNSFEVEMIAQILDENPGVKTTQAEMTKIGENNYYNKYTSQIEAELKSSLNGKMRLKEGDMFTVTVTNTNKTISQMLRNFFYQIAGNDTYQIAGQHTAVVSVNGK